MRLSVLSLPSITICIVLFSYTLSYWEVTEPDPSHTSFHIIVALLIFLYSSVKEKIDVLRKHFTLFHHTNGNNIFKVTQGKRGVV